MPIRITEKRLKDKRFRDTEEAIVMAFFVLKDKICLKRLIKTAGISRSTLYRHHENINKIVPDYEEYMVSKYKRFIQRLLKFKRIDLKTLYVQTLSFMSNNHKIMAFLLEYDNHSFLEEMIGFLKPKIISVSKITDQEVMSIYLKEVVCLIEEWGRAGFDSKKIDGTVDKIMFLTNTAYFRLSPIKRLA